MKRLMLLAAVSCAWPTEMDHSAWDALLKRYVNAQYLVDYSAWKSGGLPELDSYLARIAAPWPNDLSGEARKATLIDAYNALTVRWILKNYPVASIWRTHHPFTEVRHQLNGAAISLDAIEGELRNMGDPRIHAALVCAARSCPPLRREAYTAERLDRQLDANVRDWLSMPDRNQFISEKHKAEVSMIFKWYKADFEKNGGSVEAFLAKYVPLPKGVTLKYKPYHWGLNDASALGSDYSHAKFYWDYLRNK